MQRLVDNMELGKSYHFQQDGVFATEYRFPDALRGPNADQARGALLREVQQHVRHDTLGPSIDKAPPGFTPIPLGVLGKIKRSGDYKARAVVKGWRMQQSTEFNETFAPVPSMMCARMLLIQTAEHDWEAKQGDVNTAFLDTRLRISGDRVFLKVPNYFTEAACKPGAPIPSGYTIREACAGIPGMPQCPRLWYQRVNKVLTSNEVGLSPCPGEPSLYICLERQLFLLVWVDDLFLFFPKGSSVHATKIWATLRDNFDLGPWEDLTDMLGAVVTRDRANRRLSVSQKSAFVKLLAKTNMAECNTAPTPMAAGVDLSRAQSPSEEERKTMIDMQRAYRSIIATFLYFILWTRPDLAYAVSRLCRFMHNPGQAHYAALKRLLRYLAGTLDKGLVYDFSKPVELHGVHIFIDAAHADCPDTKRSTLAAVAFDNDCPLMWDCKRHGSVTTSTNHSECSATAKGAKMASYIDKIYLHCGFKTKIRPIQCYSDSRGSIAMNYNPLNRAASRHISIADHYARETINSGLITLSHVPTDVMIADALTKPLAATVFQRHANKLIGDVLKLP
jgi:hypothetical protein